MDPKTYFGQQNSLAIQELETLRKKIILNSILRLVTFIGVFLTFFLLIEQTITIAILVALVILICFIWLVVKHVSLQQMKTYWDAFKGITESELKACDHNFVDFKDGEQYINHRHEFSFDLDLFGKGSVFQMINRTVTQMGEKYLADLFHSPYLNKTHIENTQDAVKELSALPELLMHFRATGNTSEIVPEDKEQIGLWTSKASFVSGRKILRMLSFLLPGLLIFISIATFFYSFLSPLILLFFLVNMAIIGANVRIINNEHNRVSIFLKVFQKYQGLLAIISDQTFKSELLKELAGELTSMEKNADSMLKQLTKLVGAFDSRLNFVAAIFLEGFLLWDLHCLFKIEKWRIDCGKRLPIWLEKVSHFDALVSQSSYSFLHPDFSFPVITEDTVLAVEKLGHPIIPASKRIDNSFSINNQGEFVIITGANMAGKSTFLRAVGVNFVLAMMGSPVCAVDFRFRPMKLFTSMRTSDSLSENESYFYAELRRLKEMFDLLEKGEKLFIILDEILKGTNSIDKQKGSQLALEKIVRLHGTGIIATHDLALAAMADTYPNKIKNQCFEIEIDNARIFFDYKLYQGVTKKMNALLLMQQMGIVE